MESNAADKSLIERPDSSLEEYIGSRQSVQVPSFLPPLSGSGKDGG